MASAILTEATLSFFWAWACRPQPVAGHADPGGQRLSVLRQWWITIWPGLVLVLIALSVNLLGDWLRDALNPKLL